MRMDGRVLDSYRSLGPVAPLRAEVELVCRGEGRFYAKCVVTAQEPFSELTCSAEAEGRLVPVAAYPFTPTEGGTRQTWVLDVPLLEAPSISVSIQPDDRDSERLPLEFRYSKVKWLSRVNYRVRSGACRDIRDFEKSFAAQRYQLEPLSRFQGDCGIVWRVRVSWRAGSAVPPRLDVFDSLGNSLPAKVVAMEFDAGAEDHGAPCRTFDASIILDPGCDSFLVQACDNEARGKSAIAPGYMMVDRSRADALKAEARDRMRTADDEGAYSEWFALHQARTGDLIEQRSRTAFDDPLMSVVLELGIDDGSDVSRTSLDSVLAQSYARWELVVVGERPSGWPEPHEVRSTVGGNRIVYVPADSAPCRRKAVAEARGQWVLFLRAGDELEPDALFHYAREARRVIDGEGTADVLYCDEDRRCEGGGPVHPVFKSLLNLDLHYCGNWVGNLLAVKGSVLAELIGDDSLEYGAWLYDITLRAYERGLAFHHIARVLYHAAGRPSNASELGPVLESHLARRGIHASVCEDPEFAGSLRVKYELAQPEPLVSIVIPNKDRTDLLDACLKSIIEKGQYRALEIIVVENNSEEARTFDYYREAERRWDCVRVCRWQGEFNFSKIVNYGASEAHGDYLLLLNNDTEAISPTFIGEMVGVLQRPEVGVAGAKLLFKDGLVQHAGVGVGIWGAVGHLNQNRAAGDGGYLNRACLTGNYSAVTGACQMVRADVFRRLGGYDESFAVGFNDIDFCMRVRQAGLLVTLVPSALLYHLEFASRGRETADPAKMLRWKCEQAQFVRRWPEPFVQGDPYTGPILLRNNMYFCL